MRHNIKLPLVALLLSVLIFVSNAGAQTGEWAGHVDASLISEIIERGGDFYIATSGGLVVYNPADTTLDQFTNLIGLPSNFVTCLTFDSQGRIVVGTEESGIAILSSVGGSYDVTSLNSSFHGLADDRITSVAAWGDTIVYGSRTGIGIIVQGFPGARWDVDNGLPSNTVADVFPDGDRVWIATDLGVVTLDRQGFITDASNGLPSVAANVFARDDTALWVGTDAGIAGWDGSAWVSAGIGEAVFSIRYEATTSTLWLGTRGRLYGNDGTGWTEVPIFDIYAKYQMNNTISEIRGLLPTADGAVYAGIAEPSSERRGAFLILYDGATVRNITANGPPQNNLVRLSLDVDHSVWVSSLQFGVGKLTPGGQWFNYNSAVGDTNLSSRFVNLTLLADSQGSKWFSTLSEAAAPRPLDELRDGLDTDRSNDMWVHHNIGDGGGDMLQSLRGQNSGEDPAGNLWFLSDISTLSPGWWGMNILGADRNTWRNVTAATTIGGMKDNNITDVAFGPGGLVFVALKTYGVQQWFTGGYDQANLFDFSNDSWLDLGTVTNDFGGADIITLAVRSDGVLWIGTTIGLFKWDRGFFTEFRADRGFGVGLLSDNVTDLAFDHDENLWIATDLGLNRIARDDESDIWSFTTPVVWQTRLSLFFPPSVVSPLVDARCNALAMHPVEPLLYIATAGGLAVLDVSSFQASSSDLSQVYLYPNPIRGSRGDNALYLGNLTTIVDVAIYTLEGELVGERRNVSPTDNRAWDLLTESGYLASGGMYLARIRGGGGAVVKTFALIR